MTDRAWLVCTLALLANALLGCAAFRSERRAAGNADGGPGSHAATTPPNAAVPHATSATANGTCSQRNPARACLEAGIAQFGHASSEARFEERPARAARLRAFEIDRDEVSAAAYARCVEHGHCRAPQCDAGAMVPNTGAARCVAWSDARAFCSSEGGRLPTEAEWERAAAGLLPGHRAFPWGDEAPAHTDGGAGVNDETPEGVHSLGGSVAEWVDDAGAFYLLPARPDAGADGGDASAMASANDSTEREFRDAALPEYTDAGLVVVDDPRGPHDGPWRIVRGGNDEVPVSQWTTTRRRFRRAADRRPWIGFRCAYEL